MIKSAFTVHLTGGEDPLTIDFEAESIDAVRKTIGMIAATGLNHTVDGIWHYYPPHRIHEILLPMDVPNTPQYGYTVNIPGQPN